MHWRDVVVIVVGPTTMPTPPVEFTCQQRVGLTIILDGVEDWYTVDRQGNSAAKEMFFC